MIARNAEQCTIIISYMIKDYTILSFSFENYQHFTANPTVFDKDMVTEANPWQLKVSFKQRGATNLRWIWMEKEAAS